MIRPWALAGFSGTGKTTVGRLLADAAGRCFADLDEVIGHARVLELLLQGEDALRDAEAGALGVLADGPPGLVVAWHE